MDYGGERAIAGRHDPSKRGGQFPILAQQLIEIDQKSIRAMRERNIERVDALEAEAAALRLRLVQ
ncbi:hypothetical protein AAKU55_002859 [Oxalobacteraceae bacterium GrIS 1.11]